jgi:fido (protein-threonine AMPylation protein)
MFYDRKDVKEFLRQSNYIEGEYSDVALIDALEAWDYLMKDRKGMTTKTILNVHYHLMRNINKSIAGKFRTGPVWIGGKEKMFISVALISETIRGWIKTCNWDKHKFATNTEKENLAIDWHVLFEGIHPHTDCNGRTGRILYNYHRNRLGLPIDIIKEADRGEYYKLFKQYDKA